MINIVAAINRVVKINASKSVTATLITTKTQDTHSTITWTTSDAHLIVFIKDAREFIYFILLQALWSVDRVKEEKEEDRIKMTGKGIPLLTGTLCSLA